MKLPVTNNFIAWATYNVARNISWVSRATTSAWANYSTTVGATTCHTQPATLLRAAQKKRHNSPTHTHTVYWCHHCARFCLFAGLHHQAAEDVKRKSVWAIIKWRIWQMETWVLLRATCLRILKCRQQNCPSYWLTFWAQTAQSHVIANMSLF